MVFNQFVIYRAGGPNGKRPVLQIKGTTFFTDGPKSVNNVFISFCCFALFSFSANDAEKIPERGSYRIKD